MESQPPRWLSIGGRLLYQVTAFQAQAERVGAQIYRIQPAEAVSAAVRILREANCRTVAVASDLHEREAFIRALAAADLSEVPTATLWPTHRADAGISAARMGVAETGSVLLHASSEDRRVELCVDVHVVLLRAESLALTLDGAVAALREISLHPAAYASLVSGPSRSADIERTLTIGVHGPRAFHILLLEARS